MPLTTVQSGMMDSTAQYYSFKNRIINGAMVIDQRNAGASVTAVNGAYSLDRYMSITSQASKYSVQRVSDAPTGFINSLKATSLSAYSVTASDIFHVMQMIEGLNIADLAWGTASAATVTFSFWAKSSLTGTFGGSLVNSAEDRSYPFAYTISAANTWEYKTVTIPGDTTGTWLTTNGIGIRCHFTLGMGSNYTATAGAWTAGAKFAPTGAVSVVGTNGATLQVTGVQLEKGSTATSFDYRPYTTELALCQRYYLKVGPASNVVTYDNYNTTGASCSITLTFPVTMRATPTGSFSAIGDFGFSNTSSGTFAVNGRSPQTGSASADASAAARCQWYTNNANAFVAFSIEL